MASIVVSGDTSGAVTLSAPSVAGTNTITLPAATGTMMVSGNMPAFSAYANAGQTLANFTYTKISLQNKEFDTASCFDNTTNYRFTPTVAGYYQVTGQISWASATATASWAIIYKNGSGFKYGSLGASTYGDSVSALIYMNGTTDYIELYCYQTVGQTLEGGSGKTYFQASMVRTA